MNEPNACDEARRLLAACLDEPYPAALSTHIESCPACRAELEALSGILQAASASPDRVVPDPGDAYWDRFLPAVRARIDARGRTVAARLTPARAALAAGLLAAAALSSLLHVQNVPDPGQRLQDSLARLGATAPRITVDVSDPGILELTVEREPQPGELMEAFGDIAPPSAGDLWNDSELTGLLDRLDAESMKKLKAELTARRG